MYFPAAALKAARPKGRRLATDEAKHSRLTLWYSPRKIVTRGTVGLAVAAFALAGMLPVSSLHAQDQAGEQPVFAAGDAVVTGFSGIQPSGAPLVPGMNPLDQFFINMDGASAQIQSLGMMGEPPAGQLVAPGIKKLIPANEIGQVFPVAIMEGQDRATTPNILLGATSAFGIHIVEPDPAGGEFPLRLKTGKPGAIWMPGMFADDKGGSPGAIWSVNGQTGEVTLFATIAGNSGPGLGDIVFDKKTRQVFVSDLDTGLIHRLDKNGQEIDTFDHGVDGRPAKGLGAVPDDGKTTDITQAAFDIEKPETWGYTQTERRVHGMAMHEGRLYYTADHMVWSIGIAEDGAFAGDARWELDVETTAEDTQLSDMLFDGEGRMYVAERAAQRGSYDYSHFTEPEKAEIKRYRLEDPDNPDTESRWVADPDTYAIGLPVEHRHSNGGISLGFPYDDTGMIKTGSCGEFLWTTGERLRAGEFAQGDGEGDPAANADVHGLQGNAISMVRPENVPPMTSYFTDYDSFFGDAEKAGHMGDVEIWQPCDGVEAPQFGGLPPWWGEIPEDPPGELPPEWIPPEFPYETNLELTKWSDPKACWSWGGDWMCRYSIRIRNTGPDDYFGDLQIRDHFPANPAGLDTFFAPQPPWFCWQPGGNPADTRCWRPNVFLASGQSTFMTVWAKVPKEPRRCRLTNVAEIEWAPGGTQWNTDPTDDIDAATAIIPDPECEPGQPKRTNLELKKRAMQCWIVGNDVDCGFHITVENVGASEFFGPITVRDQMPPGVLFQAGPAAKWNCGAVAGPGTTFECTTKNPANVFLLPTDKVQLWVYGRVPIAKVKDFGCKLPNRAWIVSPLGAPLNSNPADDSDNATAQMPPALCEELKTNLRLTKTASPELCQQNPNIAGTYFCKYMIRVINEGPGVYNGDLHVKDTFPAGTELLLGPGPWTCSPPAGNSRLCRLNGVVMPKNTARSFPIWLKVPQAVAAQHECRIRNVAKIMEAPGGTAKNTNPADDQDDAVAMIPEEACKGPETKSNLKILKRGPQVCPRTSEGFKCDWTIVVRNTGPGPFNGQIVLNETLPGEPSNASWNAPWNCVGGGGGGGGAICTHPNVALPMNGSVTLNLTTLFPLAVAKANQCQLTNLVEIAKPVGGSPKNTDASDDTAQATASVDPIACRGYPPPARCPPGYEYDDGDCVPKGGQCPRGWTKTPIRGKCCPPDEPWNRRLGKCGGIEPPGIIDPIPPPPPPRVDCPRDMKEVSAQRARILRSRGWLVERFGRRTWCAKPPVRIDCPRGMDPVPSSRIAYLKGKGWTLIRIRTGQWCGKPGRTEPICDAQCQCKKKGGRWSHGQCQTGHVCWNGKTVSNPRLCPPRTHKCWNGQVLPIGKSCPPRLHKCWNGKMVPNPRLCPPRLHRCWNGKMVKSPRLCPPRRIPCPRGTVGKYQPNCKKIVKPPQRCPRGTIGRYPNCKKLPVIKLPKKCPNGTYGRFPNCKPRPQVR